MIHRVLLATTLSLAAAAPLTKAEDVKPLNILLVTGGCCHDYEHQHVILANGIKARANAKVECWNLTDTTTKAVFSGYQNGEWAKSFDVVIHDECSADVTDPAYVENIVAAHRNGTPAVALHCAMHSYRWGNFKEPVPAGADNSHWYEMLGMQSTAHGAQQPISITFVDTENPIVKGIGNWTTINEELYNNVQVLTAHPLAKGKQSYDDAKSGKHVENEFVVAWTNEFGPKKTHVFSTTIGHNNDTVSDTRYLDMVARGVLWAAGKLGDDGKPLPGYEPKADAPKRKK